MYGEGMVNPDIPKFNIKAIVGLYKKEYPEEYTALKQAVKMSREALYDPEFAKIESSEAAERGIRRGLYEISETLDAMLVQGLTIEELTWWKTTEGGHWFANTFSEFALPAKI